jgi:hypothetical protein
MAFFIASVSFVFFCSFVLLILYTIGLQPYKSGLIKFILNLKKKQTHLFGVFDAAPAPAAMVDMYTCTDSK